MKETKISPDGLQMLHDYIESLESENKLLRKDSERLEWLRDHIDSAYTRENIDKAREAMDEAMRES